MMSGMETVLGKVGRHRMVGKFSNFEKHYISQYLLTKQVSNDETYINRNIRDTIDPKELLDEHYINLFGPRILAEEKVNEMADKRETPEALVSTRDNSTQRRDWRKAVAKSTWSDIKNGVNNQLEVRRNRTMTMSDAILKDKRFTMAAIPEIAIEDVNPKFQPISVIGSHYIVDENEAINSENNGSLKRQKNENRFSSKMPSLRSSIIFQEYERLKD